MEVRVLSPGFLSWLSLLTRTSIVRVAEWVAD
jgi:hypothetical protein